MIRHPDFPNPETILKEMIGGEHMPKRMSGPPETDAERAESMEHLHRIAQDPNNIRIMCIGCGSDVPMLESACCQCGGFVCASCQRVEEDGVCEHLPLGDFDDD